MSSKKKDANEMRRERIRKRSQRKFKWFYDRKEESDVEQDQTKTQKVTRHVMSESIISTGDNAETVDGDVEVMAWLQHLDFGDDCIDDMQI